ncbi:hypothetical protein PIB30_047618 [Stylosanthes scabra]|uniref:Uncharacterized protein n=1 Tax=Stylosanthes scabra TaxID=79078 RepID=A0ABU6RGW5_9FABA|nr:hypothetical protein [Stylosanthes scabra]
MKHIILRTMGVVGQKYVRRIAYMLLDILPPLEYKFKLFWLESDDHVRAMFDLHHSSRSCRVGAIAAPPLRVATPEVSMELDFELDVEYLGETDDSSDSSEEAHYVAETHEVRRFLLPAPAAIPDLSDVSSHFHTLHLDAMQEEPREGFGGGMITST